MPQYIGLSTINQHKGPYTLVDQELVKRDLLNELSTRRGSRLMKPLYGSDLHLYLGEPNTPETIETVSDIIREIFTREPRIELETLHVVVDHHSIEIQASVIYTPWDTSETLYFEYTNKTGLE